MKLKLLFSFLLILNYVDFAFTQNTNCNEVFVPQGQLVLIHNPTKNEIALTEKDNTFLKKAGKPDKMESGKNEDAIDYDYILYKKFQYADNTFRFHFPGGGNTYEGLRGFYINDTTFSIKDKTRNLSLKVGDGLNELQKFKPGYKPNCNSDGDIDIRFIVNGKKRTEPLDDVIAVIVDRKTKKVMVIMTIYRQ